MHETVSGFINSIECADVVNNTQITVKTVMRLIKDKMMEQDNDEFPTELFNDRNQPNGNKLRTYRLYKENVSFNLFISRMHESFCLLKHVINPRSPRTIKLEVRFPTNTQITVKTVMRLIKDKMTEQDNDEFATELFNDRNQPNGNKLRTYRLHFNIDINFCSMDKQSKLTIKRFAFCINSNRMSE
jgi:hypothetical protein